MEQFRTQDRVGINRIGIKKKQVPGLLMSTTGEHDFTACIDSKVVTTDGSELELMITNEVIIVVGSCKSECLFLHERSIIMGVYFNYDCYKNY
jgi:hypothetical protein